MEYTIDNFISRLREVMYDNFPYEEESINTKKHRNRLGHIRDVAFFNLPINFVDTNTRTFDIGSEFAEENYPYYHILEDSEVIRIRGKGTTKSKGSQDKISDKKARDYGIVKWNGKTYSQEYRKNVRGVRSRAGKARKVFVDSNGEVYKINENASVYMNVHYHYIERILNATLPFIAMEFGLKQKRTQDTGLKEEYELQQSMLDIIESFEE